MTQQRKSLADIIAPIVEANARAAALKPKPAPPPKRRYTPLPALVGKDGICFVGFYDAN